MKEKLLSLLILLSTITIMNAQEDPYLWLEEVDGEKSMAFVEKQNKKTIERLSNVAEYDDIYSKSLEITNSTDKIAYPSIYGNFVYNFWRDESHVRGIWRRTTKKSYQSENPEWEILLDLDEMSEKDKVKWVYKGATGLYPYDELFQISLSKGGGDATIMREYDINKKSFVDNGFSFSESKGGADYIDRNTLIVSRNSEVTDSGYPRQVKIWERGTPINEAKLIYEGEQADVGIWSYQFRDGSRAYSMITRAMTFFTTQTFIWQNENLIKLDIPEDSEINALQNNQLIVALKSDWEVDGKTWKQGGIVSLDFAKLLKDEKDIRLIFQPDEFSSVSGIRKTKNKILINVLNNVKNELFIFSNEEGNWIKNKVDAPDLGNIYIIDTDELSDEYYFTFENFLSPTTLFLGDAAQNTSNNFKSLKSYFDESKYKVDQFHAKSKDGTMIPYFVVSSKEAKNDGNNPTLLTAYGGFEVSNTPYYSGITGTSWLDNGGVYVLANIRGGGEFGPKWHQAGLKEKRQNVYNDFHAVAEDLIGKKITSSKHLGIAGGSNGGLLVGVAFTQRPDLYNAVVCLVPLLDMKRYNKLLAGASWMGEYGNPDIPEEWEYISKYSPYQNLKEGQKYPEVLFYTSTRDDRVHPGHARKMAAKMIGMGYPVLYYENIEGGHAGSSTNKQTAKRYALQYAYLLDKLR